MDIIDGIPAVGDHPEDFFRSRPIWDAKHQRWSSKILTCRHCHVDLPPNLPRREAIHRHLTIDHGWSATDPRLENYR